MKKLSLKNQHYLIKNLSDLLDAGFSVKESLKFLKSMNNHASMMNDIEGLLMSGHTLSYSLSQYVSNDVYNQLMVSENHGDINCCLKEITRFMQVKNNQQRKIKDLLFYPFFLIAMLVIAVLGINQIILPQLGNVSSINQYDFSTLYNCLLVTAVLCITLFIVFMCLPTLRRRNLIAKMPFIGPIYKSYMGYFLAMQLHLMLRSGMELKEILQMTQKFKSHTVLNDLGIQISSQVNHGENISLIINQFEFIPSEFNNFFQQGNKMSDILKNLRAFTEIKFNEFISMTNKLINLIQPILFLIIGIGIVVAYMSILMPIYNSLRGM